MLTVKYSDPDETHFVVEAEFVSQTPYSIKAYKDGVCSDLAARGDVFVMNSSGATVAKYTFLGSDPRCDGPRDRFPQREVAPDPWPDLTEKKRRNQEQLQRDIAEPEAAEASVTN